MKEFQVLLLIHYLKFLENKYYDLIESALAKGTDSDIVQIRKFEARNKGSMCPTLTANMGTGGHNVPFIKDRWGIRKLTERECLRFQGFPEAFSFPDEVKRFARYTQLGNTVTVKVIEVLANECRRIIEESEFT